MTWSVSLLKLGLMTTNDISDDSDGGIGCLLGDLEGFLLGLNKGSLVGASAGALVGKSKDRVYRLTLQLRDPNLKNFAI